MTRWSAARSCTYDSFAPPTPPECLPLLQKCPYLERELGFAFSIVPRCAPDSPPRLDDSDDVVGLQRFNREVIMQAALDRPNVAAVDQYPDFLGHANNANRQGCSRDDNTPWLFDGTHPNDRGNRQIAEK